MVVWGVFAVLTAAVAFAVLRPYWLLRMEPGDASASDTPPLDVEIYKQQLREIDGERERGQISDTEAEAARIEVSRRLLAADKTTKQSANNTDVSPNRGHQTLTIVTIVVLAGISVSAYLIFGSPGLTSKSAATQPQSRVSRVQQMIQQVEKRLREHPEEGAGWEVIAPVYMRMGRFDDAVNAYTKAMKLSGETSDRLANLGEAMTYANKGMVSPKAKELLEKAARKQPAHPKAGFWLGVADEQAGKLAEALDRYKALLKSKLPDNAKNVVRERVADLSAKLNKSSASKDGKPEGSQKPQAAQKSSASSGSAKFSAEERAMIDNMVKRLAERLKKDGSDLDGWLKLLKSYMVQDRREDALNALKNARIQFKDNKEALGKLDASARSMGLTP
ncbi:MAG: c-type cytochrome biogenesis protein CcmI [Alphaproteobacteria bacterium]